MENIGRERLLTATTTLYCCYYKDCKNEYTTKYNLKHHIETIHLKVKKFQCEVCHKNLSTKQNLREHMGIHNGSKPYACNYCGKCYRKQGQLTLHKRVHTKNGENNIAVAETINDTTQFQTARLIMKEFEKISWEELEESQPQLPGLQGNWDKEINLPSFESILKKCKKGNNI